MRVSLDADVFKALQEGHGGWNDQMAQVSVCVCVCVCALVHVVHV